MSAIPETRLAAAVIAWLRADGWQVWQEVSSGNSAADIVAMMDGRIWIIECKASFGLDVIAQANDWRGHAHWISVAVPLARQTRASILGRRVCRDLGVGVLTVVGLTFTSNQVRIVEDVAPRIMRWKRRWLMETSPLTQMRAKLATYPQDYHEAGSACGGAWTPYKSSCATVAEYVRTHPGCTCPEMIREVGSLHYSTPSTARGSIVHWALHRKVPGVRAERDGRVVRLYPVAP